MRALLVANPVATTTSARTRDVIVRALGSDLKVDVALTAHRGHAMELARQARVEGVELVIALGGDGTVNEVVNGLLADGVGPDTPALAVVPGGSTNVFARALGLAGDPVDATSQILDAAREGRSRRIGLGRLDDRWFVANAGMGLDAAVVGSVERQRLGGARSTPALYVRAAVREFYRADSRRPGPITLERPGAEPVDRLFLAVVQNTAPWVFLRERPLHPSPRASFATGLDLFGLRDAGTAATVRSAVHLLRNPGTAPQGRHVVAVHDQPELVLRASRPLPVQVDGDHLGERSTVVLRGVPDALAVLT